MRRKRHGQGVALVVLVDSGLWISVQHAKFDLVSLAEREELAVCPAIVQEVLQGATTRARYSMMRAVLDRALMVDAPTPLDRFENAAQIFLECRKSGFTIGGYDCLIAAVAIANDIELLHDDDDFEFISDVAPAFRQRRLNRSPAAPNS